ncbi:MAG: Hint domain-containing protein [Bacteroidia bacterium]|nr:Hint domain-containing protein [Bacteroidia bacterium]
MKFSLIKLSLFLSVLLLFSCEEEALNPSVNFPDFSNCNCDFESRDFVCTSEGNWYRSECFAECLGEDMNLITADSCDLTSFDPADTLSWPIQIICHPVLPLPPVVSILSDSTKIFEINDSTFVRGVEGRCLCLSPETMIATPEGEKAVSSLKEGDWVITQNLSKQIEAQPIIWFRKAQVLDDHKMLHLCLEDGKEVRLSPSHPDQSYNAMKKLKVGDYYNGVRILSSQVLPYGETHTWDILPGGTTGLYKANGIWVGSTLFSPIVGYTQREVDPTGCTTPGGGIVSNP